jgi:hypothetical protein
MATTTFSRRIIAIIGLAVSLPTLVLAGLGILLTLRISQAVESQGVRYHRYLAQQVAESFEQELMAHLRESMATAENAARGGSTGPTLLAALLAALGPAPSEFETPHLAPLSELPDYFMLVVESQPLVYGFDPGRHAGTSFAGLMLRDSEGQVVGAGGWWFKPREFLIDHLKAVMEERLPSKERIYGGIESIRNISVMLVGPGGTEVSRVRQPGDLRTAATEPLSGPFTGFSVKIATTPHGPMA